MSMLAEKVRNIIASLNGMWKIATTALSILVLAACHHKIVPTLPPPPQSIDIQEIDFEYMHGKARLVYRVCSAGS